MEPRKRKRLALAITGFIALVAGLLLLSNHDPEPAHDGRLLSEWIAIYATNQIASPLSAEREAAAEAIRAIGTKALPFLLEWISYETAPWRFHVGRLAEFLPDWLTGGAPLMRMTILSLGEQRAQAAMQAFAAMGPIAEPLLPELEQLIQRTNLPSASRRSLFAISSLGSAAVPIMANAIVQPQFVGSPWAMICAANMGTNAWALTPIIASQLTHTNDLIADGVVYSFIMVGPTNHFDAELLVPALIQLLQDPNPRVRRRAFFPLETFGAAAAPALAALTNALSDPDPVVRADAADAIETISKRLQE